MAPACGIFAGKGSKKPEKLIDKLSLVLGCNPEIYLESLRISKADKSNRDLVVYFLWQTDRYRQKKAL